MSCCSLVPRRNPSGWFGKAGHVIGWRNGEQFDFRTSTSHPVALSLFANLPFLSLPLSPSLYTTSILSIVTMASRRLAFNLNQALRTRQALKAVQPVKRGFASPVSLPSTTQSTTLSNGFTVCDYSRIDPNCFAGLLMKGFRSPLSTRHGLRPRPWVCGSTPVAEQRPTRRMEPRTSSSTWLSR